MLRTRLRRNILILDDQFTINDLLPADRKEQTVIRLCEKLQGHADIQRIGDKTSAEAYLGTGNFSLFIMDLITLRTPGSGISQDVPIETGLGIDFYWRIRENFKELPILIYTNASTDEVLAYDSKFHGLPPYVCNMLPELCESEMLFAKTELPELTETVIKILSVL